MNVKYVVGIDPGLRGGFCIINMDGKVVTLYELKQISLVGVAINSFMATNPVEPQNVHVFLEKANTRPGHAVQAMFNYGAGWGEIIGSVRQAAYPLHLVPPHVWAKVMHAGTYGDDTKKKSFEACKLLFPHVSLVPVDGRNPHDGLAEALLIAEYGRRRTLAGD